jgi:hypothetical protein
MIAHFPNGKPMPVSLTDEEFNAVRAAAGAAPYAVRGEFLRRVAAELQTHRPEEMGVGLIARVVRGLQLEPQYRPDLAVGASPSSRRPRQRAG